MKRWGTLGLLVGLLALTLAAYWWIDKQGQLSPPADDSAQSNLEDLDAEKQVPQYPAGISEAEFQQAIRWFDDLYPGRKPDEMDVLSVAGELAMADGRMEVAARCFQEIPTEHPTYGMAARLQQGTSLLELNRASEAEENLQAFLGAARYAKQLRVEDVVLAFKWLNYILSVELRLEDRKPVLAEVHQLGLADVLDSKQYFFPNLLLLNSPAGRKRIQQFAEQDPGNLAIQVAKGRYLVLEGKFDEAIEWLEGLRNSNPEDKRVIAALLEVYFDSGAVEKFDAIAAGLPAYEQGEPWMMTRFRGEYALQEGDASEAVRMFEALLDQDPANAPCQMGLATALGQMQEADKQKSALEKSGILAQIRVNLNKVQGDQVAALQELIDRCDAIGFDAAVKVFKLHAEAVGKR
jgi:predicted Zn-dependent protease